jgi:AmmeMemoRadiSam system protein B
MDLPVHPQIRTLNAIPARQGQQQMILLEDPLGISDASILIPPEATPLLLLCDGTRTLIQIHHELFLNYGLDIKPDEIKNWLTILDDAALLENQKFHERKQEVLEQYRSAEARQMSLADEIYPSTPEPLREMLDHYLVQAQVVEPEAMIRGMICPHIDYSRGWQTYARVMSATQSAIQESELIIVLGTDHFDNGNPITLTYQNYQTPYGTLPTPENLVDHLLETLTDIDPMRAELRHAHEHSIELALIWLHHMRSGAPCQVLPILCGAHDLLLNEHTYEPLPWLSNLLRVLQQITKKQKTLVIAAADLAHVGRAFGEEQFPADRRSELATADEQLLEPVKSGDPIAFVNEIVRVNDRFNVCGTSPIYMLLKLLEPSTAQIIGYELCPADHEATSWVSICGGLIF